MITFFGTAPFEIGEVVLGEDAAHHASVRRLSVGDDVAITEGRGFRRTGRIASLTKKSLVVSVDALEEVRRPPPVHLVVPVADKDRMLWLAEKAAELQATTWTPVMYRRSKSVSPRGEGDAFERKIVARMIAALEQSHGTWLPQVLPVCEVGQMRGQDQLPAVVLDRGGQPLGTHPGLVAGVTIAVGPEGGFEPDEADFLASTGWSLASLGDTTLRFETAGIAALAVARSMIAAR